MANQRTYVIEVKGVKESYESVSKLADVLDKLTDKTVKVSTEIDKQTKAVADNTKQVQQSTKANDELGKATKKLEEFDAEYEKELQRVKSQLSAQKKEVSDLIKQEEAQSIVEAKQLNSYAEKQKYLTSLNKLIRNHANVTDEDKQEIMEMVQESAKLQQELKNWDYEMKIYTRNVGNYPGQMGEVADASRNLKQELRSLTDEMSNMLASGIDKTDPKFQSLAKRAGQLKDAISDAQDEVKHFASDTKGIDNVINLAQTATSVWGLYSNAVKLFGDENEEVTESMKQMMVVMSTLQQLQTLQNALTSQGSATMKVYEAAVGGVSRMLGLNTTATQASTAATEKLTTAQKAGAVASKALSVALRSIPLMFIIGLVVTLITEWESVWTWFKNTIPLLDTLGKKVKQFGGFINTLRAALVGFGQAIVNFVTNPIKTLAKVLDRLFALDFVGAYNAVREGLDQQFRGSAEAFKKGFQQQVEKGLEDITLKAMKEGNKQTQQELAELKIRERNNKTYSEKYIELQKKDFEERKKLAKGNQDELNKIKLEEMQFDAECEDQKTAYMQEQQKEREKAAKEAAAKSKKLAAEAAKAAEEYKKKLEELGKATEENIKDANAVIKASVEQSKKLYKESLDEAYKNQLEEYLAEADFSEKKKYWNEESFVSLENYWIKRKELVIQELLAEADETKKHYENIIKETETLIKHHEELLKTAGEEERKNLEEELKQLQTTLQKTTKEMRTNLGEYAENPIIIPFEFDADSLMDKFNEQGKKMAFSLVEIFEMIAGTGEETIRRILESYIRGTEGSIDKVKQYFTDMAVVAMLPKENIDEINKTLDDMAVKFKGVGITEFNEQSKEYIENIRKLFVGANTDITKLGQVATKTLNEMKKVSDDFDKDVGDTILKNVEKVFSTNEKLLKSFQEAAKGIKLEIVSVDDVFTETFGGQIMSIDKTRERYDKLKKAYEEYLDVLEERRDEELWNKKIHAIKLIYGEDSDEYKLVIREKEKADAEYLMEHDKVMEQIRQIDKKTNEIIADYAQSLGKRIQDIYKAINDNLFEPLADGFTALLDYQIEEAEKRLEDVEKILDKAVELREDSEEKIEEINNKLKESDQGNTEALKQQLADEQVLLVQRQQNERDLQKQKEREEAIIQKKEKQARKIELSQKLIEAIVNGALGVTSALKYGPILGPIFAAIIGAMSALQVGIITKQISKLEKGGKLTGPSHKNGGMRVEGTNIEVEGGEYVINKKSTTKYINLIEAINEDKPAKVRRLANKYENGGTTIINNYNNTPLVSSSIRKFANGGRLDYAGSVSAIERQSDAYRMTEAIENMNMQPVVAVRDIVRKTNDVAKVVDLAGGNLKR